jgi:hypothetical protein
MKGLGRWFGLAPSGCGRAAHGGTWRGGVDRRGVSGSGVRRWEKTPGWTDLGRRGLRAGQRGKNPKENENGLPTLSRPKCELGFIMDF